MISVWRSKSIQHFQALFERRQEALRARLGAGAGDLARQQREWSGAISAYKDYLERRPDDVGIWVRLAKTYLAAGEFELAEAAVRRALALRPRRASLHRNLAEILVASRGEDDVAGGASRAMSSYQRFRADLTIPAPPCVTDTIVNILVDARGLPPITVRNMLVGLRASVHQGWRAQVIHTDLMDHPVASLAYEDSRIALVSAVDGSHEEGPWLILAPGAIVDPQALGWLLFAIMQDGVAAAYADHDQAINALSGRVWSDPAFQAAADVEDMCTNPHPPILAMFSERPEMDLASPILGGSAAMMRSWLVAAFAQGTVVHVPLLLSTLMKIPGLPGLPSGGPACDARGRADEGGILVVIPTRDEPAMLGAMVESLIAKADRSAQLRILVVDNRSRLPETAQLLRRLIRDRKAEVLPMDEPFNWSRFNNLAADTGAEPFLVFANNDMEMLTQGWDTMLREALLRPGNGVVGARLLYPGGQMQHGGLALGGPKGEPIHEGLGEAGENGGPLDRWTRSRPAAALTGAFLAVRRDVFEAVEGFDPINHIVACNDIDFCLRVRRKGWRVLYLGNLVLTHFESMTRGHADSRAKAAWAEAEMASLAERWGGEAFRDPGRNPHWIGHGVRLFSALRAPTAVEVLAYLGIARRGAWGVEVSPILFEDSGRDPDLGV